MWAVGLGLIANLILTAGGLRRQVDQALRTELYLKTGLVLMGATVNFRDILMVGARGIIQALLVVGAVFLLTWAIGGWLKLDQKLYVTALVILFALPLMIIQPFLANLMELSPDVASLPRCWSRWASWLRSR